MRSCDFMDALSYGFYHMSCTCEWLLAVLSMVLDSRLLPLIFL